MTANQTASKPCIVIQMQPHAGYERKLRELTAGMEEEGIPYRMIETTTTDTVEELAHEAATQSQLGVGVGITTAKMCIHYVKLPIAKPLFVSEETDNLSVCRALGYNAARLVKGIPFKSLKAVSEDVNTSLTFDQKEQEDSMALYQLVSSIVSRVLQESAHGHGEVLKRV
ncbi:MAG: glycerol dehydratase reactivase beta/small subunit family protein [Sporomusaceae bacterium]|nr:glycerol dehydratase reactivase beta/small subunit family protein [Sporomusaceae bacterium]